MDRTIKVKGTGALKLEPDLIETDLTLSVLMKEYDETMYRASEVLKALQEALEDIGFDRQQLKTSNFSVSTEREYEYDENGKGKSVFKGYRCRQYLKLSFDYDIDRLSLVLSAIAGCVSEPELRITFSIKNKDEVKKELLAEACKNAREKAEILACASGEELGELLSIDYEWSDMDFSSPTGYSKENICMNKCSDVNLDITPEDVTVRDSAQFVWALKSKKYDGEAVKL